MFLVFATMNFEKIFKYLLFQLKLVSYGFSLQNNHWFQQSPCHLRGAYMRHVEYYREDNSNGLRRKKYLIVYYFLGFSI